MERKLYPFPGKRGRKLRSQNWELFQTLAVSNIVSAAGTLLRKAFFTELGGFDEDYRLLEDWPAWLRLAREGYEIPLLDRVTCLYGAGGVSSQNLNAYCAPELQKDMALCYEKEILPYLDECLPKQVKRIRYGYDQVCGLPHRELLERYGWLERRTGWKRIVKKWLLGK